MRNIYHLSVFTFNCYNIVLAPHFLMLYPFVLPIVAIFVITVKQEKDDIAANVSFQEE